MAHFIEEEVLTVCFTSFFKAFPIASIASLANRSGVSPRVVAHNRQIMRHFEYAILEPHTSIAPGACTVLV